MGWPKEVPILTARDFCRGRFHHPNGTHCLLGWRNVVFPGPSPESTHVLEEIQRRIGTLYVPEFNDDPQVHKRELARVWNDTMAALGYTEIEEYEVAE